MISWWGRRSGAKWNTIIVPVRNRSSSLLPKWQFPRLDVLCVDVEGTESMCWKAATMVKWRRSRGGGIVHKKPARPRLHEGTRLPLGGYIVDNYIYLRRSK